MNVLILGVTLGMLAAAMTGPPAAAQGPVQGPVQRPVQTPGSPERGAEIAQRWCTDCHAVGQAPRAADVAPTFPEIARTRSPDYVRGFLANPHLRGLMPPFDLARAQIEDIVAYIRTLE